MSRFLVYVAATLFFYERFFTAFGYQSLFFSIVSLVLITSIYNIVCGSAKILLSDFIFLLFFLILGSVQVIYFIFEPDYRIHSFVHHIFPIFIGYFFGLTLKKKNKIDFERVVFTVLMIFGGLYICEFLINSSNESFLYKQIYEYLQAAGIPHSGSVTPEIQYFLFGEWAKPRGVLLEASASGIFMAISMIIVLAINKNNKYFEEKYLIGFYILAIIISGSKSAYLITIIYFLIQDPSKLINRLIFIFTLVPVVVLSIYTLSEVEVYINAFIFTIFDKFISGELVPNFMDLIIGRADPPNVEISFLVEPFQYGILIYGIAICIVYFFSKYFKMSNPHVKGFGLIVFLSFCHYSVLLQSPLSLFVGILAGLYKNYRREKDGRLVQNECCIKTIS